MADTKIEWTDATWNPVAGCTILTAGCTNCYAMRMAARLEAMGTAKYDGLTRKSGERYIWTGKVALDHGALEAPKSWRKPRLIFVNSMSDLFQEAVPEDFIAQVWETMAATPQHTYQILTKRPDRMADITPRLPLLRNVWLGASVENAAVLERIAQLRAAKAAVKFISFEPLIGSVADADISGIDWAIVGGESGPRARPMLSEWVDEIYDACGAAGTAFFFKQWGGRNKKAAGRTFRGTTFDEMPIYTS
jgi:protein gp37